MTRRGGVPFPYRCSCQKPVRRHRESPHPVRAAQRLGAGTSQQVDDVREEDEADDGEKHQHQDVHHDGDAAGGDGR